MKVSLEKLREKATTWRKDNGYVGKLGVIVFSGETLQGWCNELRDPQNWQPNCIAIDEFGVCYQTKGGNNKDGAKEWVALSPKRNTKSNDLQNKLGLD